jgi:hypothetical protein
MLIVYINFKRDKKTLSSSLTLFLKESIELKEPGGFFIRPSTHLEAPG